MLLPPVYRVVDVDSPFFGYLMASDREAASYRFKHALKKAWLSFGGDSYLPSATGLIHFYAFIYALLHDEYTANDIIAELTHYDSGAFESIKVFYQIVDEIARKDEDLVDRLFWAFEEIDTYAHTMCEVIDERLQAIKASWEGLQVPGLGDGFLALPQLDWTFRFQYDLTSFDGTTVTNVILDDTLDDIRGYNWVYLECDQGWPSDPVTVLELARYRLARHLSSTCW